VRFLVKKPLRQLHRDFFIQNIFHRQRDDGPVLFLEEALDLRWNL